MLRSPVTACQGSVESSRIPESVLSDLNWMTVGKNLARARFTGEMALNARARPGLLIARDIPKHLQQPGSGEPYSEDNHERDGRDGAPAVNVRSVQRVKWNTRPD